MCLDIFYICTELKSRSLIINKIDKFPKPFTVIGIKSNWTASRVHDTAMYVMF